MHSILDPLEWYGNGNKTQNLLLLLKYLHLISGWIYSTRTVVSFALPGFGSCLGIPFNESAIRISDPM
jgi:hypothetical protein